MFVYIGDYRIELPAEEVKAAKKMINHLIDTAARKGQETGSPFFKYTLITTMYVMCNDYIQSLGPDVLQKLLEAVVRSDVLQQQQERHEQIE